MTSNTTDMFLNATNVTHNVFNGINGMNYDNNQGYT